MRFFPFFLLFIFQISSLFGQDSTKVEWILGGVVHYSNLRTNDLTDLGYVGKRERVNKILEFSFDPYLIYKRSENWEIGLGVHWYYNKNVRINILSETITNEKKIKRSDIGIGAQVRRNFIINSRLNIYLQTSFQRLIQNYKEREEGTFIWLNGKTWMSRINLTSGFSYKIRKRFQIIINYGKLSYSFGQKGTFEKSISFYKHPIFVRKDVNTFDLEYNYFSFGLEYIL